jgi:hypothetical protein
MRRLEASIKMDLVGRVWEVVECICFMTVVGRRFLGRYL